jgi:hypothetical protein
VGHIDRSTFFFYLLLLDIALYIFSTVRNSSSYLQGRRLKHVGQVRQGRIVSFRPFPIGKHLVKMHYEVPTNDGSMVKGMQPVKRSQADELTPDTPIAILYADPKTHFVL